jgi:hypothetical protein
MSNEMTITRDEAIKLVISELEGPLGLGELVERVLALWPSRAKNPASTIRSSLRQEHAGRRIIFLTDETVVPIGIAMQGVRFRIPLSRQEVNRGVLFVYPGFTCFLPQQTPPEQVKLLDASNNPLPIRIIEIKQTEKTIFGPNTYYQPAFELSKWYKGNRADRNDNILVTIEDWDARQFRLVYEPARERKRHQAEIERQNQELTNLLFDMLETAQDERIHGSQAVLTAYVRLSKPGGYPGDHWLDVIRQDGRMKWDGYEIRYADALSPFERMLREPDMPVVQEAPFSAEQARQVYCFKAAFLHNKSLWRRIEIQGEQTLYDFDRELRLAFQHDTFDHLSGFWKLVQRGKSRRFREVDLGTINPFEGGAANELALAGLGLEVGDQLKYVYDFGDWIEHRITLESITKPEEGVEYPRLTGQNKPRYQYCRHCQDQGRETIATWICLECSTWEDQALVCEECLETHHEEHYAEEMLY